MQREQNTGKPDCPEKDRVEPKRSQGVQSIGVCKGVNGDNANGIRDEGHRPWGNPERSLLDAILDYGNMVLAIERVISNRGSAGVDGMTVDELFKYFDMHQKELCESIRGGWYKPKPVKRVEIPKPDGGKRLLGVPTVIDRMVQQAMVQVLQPIFEKTFSDSSYGFRPGRSAHQAIQQALKYYEHGYLRHWT